MFYIFIYLFLTYFPPSLSKHFCSSSIIYYILLVLQKIADFGLLPSSRSDKCAKMWPLSLMNLHNKYFIHMYKCTVPYHIKRVITYLTSIFTSRLCSLNQSFAVLSTPRSPLVPHRLSREFYCNKPSRQGHFKLYTSFFTVRAIIFCFWPSLAHCGWLSFKKLLSFFKCRYCLVG